MTETDFYLREVATWGQDYVESLIDEGYTIVKTDRGYGWLAPDTQRVSGNSTAQHANAVNSI